MSQSLIDSNPTSGSGGGVLNMQSVHPSTSAIYLSSAGIAITMPSNILTVSSIQFNLKKSGSPTGNAIGRLYAATGTVGTNAVPTGGVLVSTGTLDVSTLTTSYVLYELTFTSAYMATPNASYCFVLENPGSGVDASNYPIMDCSSGATHSGNSCYYMNSAWGVDAAVDPIFYLYGTTMGGSFLFNFV
jgi:hypothetical protein